MYAENIEKISLAAQKLTQIEEESADLTSIYSGNHISSFLNKNLETSKILSLKN